jgi:hypothetical protein
MQIRARCIDSIFTAIIRILHAETEFKGQNLKIHARCDLTCSEKDSRSSLARLRVNIAEQSAHSNRRVCRLPKQTKVCGKAPPHSHVLQRYCVVLGPGVGRDVQ